MKNFLCTNLMVWLFTASVLAQAGISAAPMKMMFTTAKGGTQNLTVSLHNPGNQTLELSASLNDWYRDSTGNIVTAPAGSLGSSCSPWVRLFPVNNFTLAPGEKKDITVSLNIPDSAANKVRNSMLFFTQMNPQQEKEKNGISINLAVRVGIQLYYTPPGLYKKNIDIVRFRDVWPKEKDSLTGKMLLLSLHNNGDVVTDGKVSLELVNLTTGKKTALPDAAFYTLPGAIRVLSVPISAGLPPGKYSATAMVDYGREEELKIGELEFNYFPKK